MKQKPQTGKRMVSKGEYLAVQASRTVLRASALVSIVEVVVCVFLALSLPLLHLGLLGWLAALFCVIMAAHQGRYAAGKLKMIARIEEVVPLTQANAALLPSTQTLARPSSAPPQELQHILLRAAKDEQQTSAEQLLRSTSHLANVADLPAPQSLARASQEPVQAQEAVLLPAAPGTQEKQKEQLLRASSFAPPLSGEELS